MNRLVSAGALIYAQPDIFSPSSPHERISGLDFSDIQFRLFINNSTISWPLVSGLGVPDSSIVSGKVYFNQITSNEGFYSVRFFADRVAFWRLVLQVPSYMTESMLDFDVVAPGALRPSPSGLVASTGC
jgi:hypothetical protein